MHAIRHEFILSSTVERDDKYTTLEVIFDQYGRETE